MPDPAPSKNRSCLIKGLAGLALVLLVLGGLWWWHNRPIRPVILTPAEKQTVEAKLEAIEAPDDGPVYEKGSKEIVLTERELNGLLHQNTNLGNTVRLELARGAVHARVETDLDPDLPVVGGRRLKARARFLIGGEPGSPALVLDDVTLWGISLPNDWLGGIKGHDLLGRASGGRIAGVRELRVEPGRIVIRLTD